VKRSRRCLTASERAVVLAVLETGSEKAAADRLGRSPSTIKNHLANARSKAGVDTTAQLAWFLAREKHRPIGPA
jgi:DNA-binding NarL/FixJ family response regulator